MVFTVGGIMMIIPFLINIIFPTRTSLGDSSVFLNCDEIININMNKKPTFHNLIFSSISDIIGKYKVLVVEYNISHMAKSMRLYTTYQQHIYSFIMAG